MCMYIYTHYIYIYIYIYIYMYIDSPPGRLGNAAEHHVRVRGGVSPP